MLARNYYYPAIFHVADEGGFWVSFPDFPECMTQGNDLDDAYKMAVEAMGLCIDEKLKNNEDLPKASIPTDFVIERDDFSCLIEFDYIQYKKIHSGKAVKKTLSIPEWLNEAAISNEINFSQVLQEALMQKLGIN